MRNEKVLEYLGFKLIFDENLSPKLVHSLEISFTSKEPGLQRSFEVRDFSCDLVDRISGIRTIHEITRSGANRNTVK